MADTRDTPIAPHSHPSPVEVRPDRLTGAERSAPLAGAEPSPPRRGRGEHGQALPLVAGGLVLVALLAVGAVRLGGVVTDRARAHTAADAAALAGAAEGRTAAAKVAAANGGRLTGYQSSGSSVEVTVRVGDVRAVARAELQW
jgi:hypothetical protein